MDRRETLCLTIECLLTKIERMMKWGNLSWYHHGNNCFRTQLYAKINEWINYEK